MPLAECAPRMARIDEDVALAIAQSCDGPVQTAEIKPRIGG